MPFTRKAFSVFAALLGVASSASSGFAQAPVRSPMTFTRDVAPIVFANCGVCHHPGGPAPFSLLTYALAKQHATQMAEVTRRRLMPPWKSEPGFGEFIGQRYLTEAEIGTIQQWVQDGAPEGEALPFPVPAWTEGWQLGKPDLVVSLPAPFLLRSDGIDVSRVFVLPVPTTSRHYVKGLEFRPGNPRVVHHANIRVDPTRASRQLDERDPEPGYDGVILRSAVFPDGYFLGWTPGQVSPLLPNGTAWRLDPGSDLVVEIHMQPSGKSEAVEPSIGLYFADDAPERMPVMLRLGRQNIDIAAGQSGYVIEDAFVLPVDADVLAVQPHAHHRAREVTAMATLPDGTATWLINIQDWDFRWQHVYRFVTPLRFPRGTTIAMRYTYDNSSANVRNPLQPPVRVTWGQLSRDEMGDLWVQVLTRNDRDRQVLTDSFRPKLIAEDAIGYETMIRRDPSKVTLHDDVAVLYLEMNRPQDAAVHFKASAELAPQSAAAHYNYATALTMTGKLTEAIEHFERAIAIRPDYALAHNNLGDAFVRLGRASEALRHFREAIRLDPGYADAHFNLGSVLNARGRQQDSIVAFRRAIELKPDLIPALVELGWLLASARDATDRDSAQAMRIAERAVSLTERREAKALDVLAAALAASGRFEAAVETAQAALALGPPETLAAAIRKRQELYAQKKPYVLP
jgi:tetratricopeptide (TPR) repeat protein/mono/diheme cytochrome c family protein